MNGIVVQKSNGESINITVIRYFRLNNFDYLVFSLNEIDDGGYVKLYISKIVNGLGVTIDDDVEWNLVKDTIKDIIKRNKDGIPIGVNDLNEANISQIKIENQKVFKLNDSLLQLLSANKSIQNNENDTTQVEPKIEDTITDVTTEKNDKFLSQNTTPVNNSIIEPQINEINTVDNNTPLNNVSDEKTISNPSIDSNIYYNGDVEPVNNGGTSVSTQGNYKDLYENEVAKNKELTEQLEKYQNLINDLKEVLK
jgi:hypothetical protein